LPSDVASLVSALSTEFTDSDVSYAAAIPTTFTAPSVVVAPGDPFLSPGTYGAITEVWDILVVVSFRDKAAGLVQMRDLSLRVRRVVSSVGARWVSASGPRVRQEEQNKDFVISVNRIEFHHLPTEEGSS
jgi:hypothetical protein